MRPIQLAGPCLAASLLLAPATAQAFDWSLEATITNDLIDGAERRSPGRPALVLEAEGEANGFFFGFDLETIRIDDDRIEIVPFLGYRHDFDPVELEIGIERAWADDSGWDDLEIFAGIEWAVDDRLTLGAEVVYVPSPREWELGAGIEWAVDPRFTLGAGAVYNLSDSEWAEIEVTGAYAFDDRLALSATLGREPADRVNYANVGLTYAVTDILAADFRVHRASTFGTRVALSLTAALGN